MYRNSTLTVCSIQQFVGLRASVQIPGLYNVTFTQIVISSIGRVGISGNVIDEDIGV